MEKLQIAHFPKAKVALALSHHVGNSTAIEGTRINTTQHSIFQTDRNYRSEIRHLWHARLGSRVLAGHKKYRRSHLKSIPRITTSRANLQDTEEEQRYSFKRNGVVIQAISFSKGEARLAENSVGECQSNHKPVEMGIAEQRDSGSKGRIN